MSYYDSDDRPTRAELNAELWDETGQPHGLPAPLTVSRAEAGRHGEPVETVRCTEHHRSWSGDRTAILYWARRHLAAAHAPPPAPEQPEQPDPWAARPAHAVGD